MSEISHAEIARKVDANSAGIETVKSEIGDIRDAQAEMARAQEALAASQKKMTDDMAQTRELVEAYAAVKTGGRFVAWFAKFMAGLLALWVFLRGGAQFLVEIGSKPPA